MPRTEKHDSTNQIDKFKDASRELEADDREEAFDKALKRIASSPPKKADKSEKAKPAK